MSNDQRPTRKVMVDPTLVGGGRRRADTAPEAVERPVYVPVSAPVAPSSLNTLLWSILFLAACAAGAFGIAAVPLGGA